MRISPIASEMFSIEFSRCWLEFSMCCIDFVCDSTCSRVFFIRVLSPITPIVSLRRITTGLFTSVKTCSILLSFSPYSGLLKSTGLTPLKLPAIILSIVSSICTASWSDKISSFFFLLNMQNLPIYYIKLFTELLCKLL